MYSLFWFYHGAFNLLRFTHYFLDSKTLVQVNGTTSIHLLTLDFVQKRQHNEELDCCSISFPLSFLSAFKYRFEKSRIQLSTKQTQCRHFSQSIVRSYNDIFLSSSGMCFLNSIDIVGNVVWNINYRYNNKLFIC